MSSEATLHLAGILRESIVDGPGYRFTVFAQGCPHHCEGCHNPQTHPFSGGFSASVDSLVAEIKKNRHLKGVTFSGGEPLCQAPAFSVLAQSVHALGLDVICYSGYTYEQLVQEATDANGWMRLLRNIDFLIDGKFILAQRSLLLRFRGSANQRIIDVPASLRAGAVVQTEL